MNIKQLAAPAALALMIAIGAPAHAGGDKQILLPVACVPAPVACSPTPVKCDPTPVVCVPTPVQCSPVPECSPKGAVPEPASVALMGVGSLLLLPLGMRAMKSRRQAA